VVSLPNLREIEERVRDLAARIGATDRTLPTFGRSEGSARPHIEVDRSGLHYLVVERGEELNRITTRDFRELLWTVFKDVTFSLACDFELRHRVSGQDCRRLIFAKQIELLGRLLPEWAEHEARAHAAILKQHPFDDASAERASLAADLRRAGQSAETAWRNACMRFPLPEPSCEVNERDDR
jgi:hypothetical protein